MRAAGRGVVNGIGRSKEAGSDREAGGNKAELDLLLVHAEDQLMSAESFKILCSEFLDIYRRFDAVEKG